MLGIFQEIIFFETFKDFVREGALLSVECGVLWHVEH